MATATPITPTAPNPQNQRPPHLGFNSSPLQNGMLKRLRDEKTPVYLEISPGGVSVGGVIERFDVFSILLVTDNRRVLYYKHSIIAIYEQ